MLKISRKNEVAPRTVAEARVSVSKRKTQLAPPDEGWEPGDPRAEEAPESVPRNGAPASPDAAPILAQGTSVERSLVQTLEDRIRRLEDVLAALHTQTAIQEPPSSSGAAAIEHPLPAFETALPPANWPPAAFPSQRWLPFEMLAEIRAMIRMYFDPRYRLTWQTRLLPPLILLGMFLSYWILPFLIDRPVFLALAYVLFKVLTREATRYRITSPDLPPSLRL